MTASSSRSRRQQIRARIQARQPANQPGYRWRTWLVWCVLFVGQLGLSARLVWLQVNEAPRLKQYAQGQQLALLAPRTKRHPIVDINGQLLAKDEPIFQLFVHPYLMEEHNEDPAVVAAKLGEILGTPATELLDLFQTAESGIPVQDRLPEDVAEKIWRLGINGVDLLQKWQRRYPTQELTAGILGYVDFENQGQAGLEYSQNGLLEAESRPWLISRDGMGLTLPDRFPLEPLNSQDLTLKLTLNTRLQWAARTALAKKMQEFNASRGTVIVMDVQNGSLAALVSEPSFNPEEYYKADPALFRNWAVTDLYEPGSTFKPINVAVALELGGIEANSVIFDEGRITVGGWPIQNNDGMGRGALTITQIMEYSSNVAMVRMMERVKATAYFDFMKKLGLGQMTGTDLPFETAGQFKERQQFVDYGIEPATTSFGQGFSLTPLQMAQLHGAIANGGILVTPHIIDGMYNIEGERVQSMNLIKPRRVFSQKNADSVRQMMGSVVANGTGQSAKIPGYRLGGKTGTAQKAIDGVYSNERITSFAASFPLEEPQYVILAVVDNPKGGNAYGSTVAAPIVKEVIEAVIAIQGIPPTHPEEMTQPAESVAGSTD
ncbi:penicillin-binding protein 2 [Synechococcales cyanobacterium C]|uniref:Penicillin-binding protein 2 n=1 Tax=Petrachloros mirabilis ULC683 TaxID=2781853 RepID=A0A8K2ACJ9_9CYAN|nr:penicillin-binding protein 2 [Petrachloros mirabilis]NCJ05494.1 penicillin-binding protein 2 [Petrachloros mirabilis ULC683]